MTEFALSETKTVPSERHDNDEGTLNLVSEELSEFANPGLDPATVNTLNFNCNNEFVPAGPTTGFEGAEDGEELCIGRGLAAVAGILARTMATTVDANRTTIIAIKAIIFCAFDGLVVRFLIESSEGWYVDERVNGSGGNRSAIYFLKV